ncbi:MAG: hypothetical protein AAF467_07220 [Actinomycetota bacterium]
MSTNHNNYSNHPVATPAEQGSRRADMVRDALGPGLQVSTTLERVVAMAQLNPVTQARGRATRR